MELAVEYHDKETRQLALDPYYDQLSSVFLVVKPSKFISLYKILYPKRRIKSYSILGTIVSPNKILYPQYNPYVTPASMSFSMFFSI